MIKLIEIVRQGDLVRLKDAMRDFNEDTKTKLVNETLDEGCTLLHVAAHAGHPEIVHYLLGFGAPLDVKDRALNTACDLARAAGHDEIVALLSARMDWLNRHGKQISMNRALRLMEEAYQSIAEGQGKDLILTLGETGVGKSTLINYLNGVVYGFEGIPGFDLRTVLVAGKEIARVGHNPVVSETLYPQVLTVNTGTVPLNIADLSGMNGTRESALELVGTLSAHLISKMASGVKGILFVIDGPSLNVGKGGAFRQTIKTLSKILQGNFESEITRSVFFAITKVPAGVTVDAVVRKYLQPAKMELEKLVASEGLDEEGSATYHTLELMLNARERIFLPNVCDNGNCRHQMLTALSNSPVMPKDCLDLLHVDKHQETFMRVLTILSHEYTMRSERVHKVISERMRLLNQLIDEQKADLSIFRDDIANLNRMLGEEMSSTNALLILTERNRRIGEIQANTRAKLIEEERLQLRVEVCQEIIQELNVNIPVEYGRSYRFFHVGEFVVDVASVREPNWVGSLFSLKDDRPKITKKKGKGHHSFKNLNIPIPGEIRELVCRNEGGTFEEKSISDNNEFNVDYSYPLGESVFSEVTAKIAKRDLPENKVRIQQQEKIILASMTRLKELKEEIETLQQQQQMLVSEIETLQVRGVVVALQIEDIKSHIRQREALIEKVSHVIALKESEKATLTQESKHLQLELRVNDDIFKTVVAIIRLLKLDNPTYEMFYETVKSYIRDNAQTHSIFFTARTVEVRSASVDGDQFRFGCQ